MVADDLGVDDALVEPDADEATRAIHVGIVVIVAGLRVVVRVEGVAHAIDVRDLCVADGAEGSAVVNDEPRLVVHRPGVVLDGNVRGSVDAEADTAVVGDRVARHRGAVGVRQAQCCAHRRVLEGVVGD